MWRGIGCSVSQIFPAGSKWLLLYSLTCFNSEIFSPWTYILIGTQHSVTEVIQLDLVLSLIKDCTSFWEGFPGYFKNTKHPHLYFYNLKYTLIWQTLLSNGCFHFEGNLCSEMTFFLHQELITLLMQKGGGGSVITLPPPSFLNTVKAQQY